MLYIVLTYKHDIRHITIKILKFISSWKRLKISFKKQVSKTLLTLITMVTMVTVVTMVTAVTMVTVVTMVTQLFSSPQGRVWRRRTPALLLWKRGRRWRNRQGQQVSVSLSTSQGSVVPAISNNRLLQVITGYFRFTVQLYSWSLITDNQLLITSY